MAAARPVSIHLPVLLLGLTACAADTAADRDLQLIRAVMQPDDAAH